MLLKIFLKLLLLVEIIFFSYVYLYGPRGFKALEKLVYKNNIVLKKMSLIEREVSSLNIELQEWKEDVFKKERVAREVLQMAFSNEEIYLFHEDL